MRIRHKSRHPTPLASNRRRIAIYSTTSHLLRLSDPDQPIHHRTNTSEGEDDGAKGGEDDVLDPFVGGSVLAMGLEKQ